MDIEPLDLLLAELRAERPAVLNIIEGLQHHLEQADITVATRQEVEALLEVYQVRDRMMVNLATQLAQARVTMVELLEHGFPDLPESAIDDRVCNDLDQNLESILAARRQFKPRVVTTTEGKSVVSEEEPIP